MGTIIPVGVNCHTCADRCIYMTVAYFGQSVVAAVHQSAVASRTGRAHGDGGGDGGSSGGGDCGFGAADTLN